MSNPNINVSNLDARYAKPTDVASAISAQAVTDAGQYAPLSGSVRRILYNATTSSWPARPNTSIVPAGMVEYISAVSGVINPPDIQIGDTLDIALPVPVNTVAPAISGTAQVGSVLTSTTGTWTNNPTSYSYQWNRAGSAIGGATSSTYTLIGADQNNAISVTVTAILNNSNGYATSASTSNIVGVIAFTNTLSSWTGQYYNSSIASSTAQVHGVAANSIAVTASATATSYGMNSAGGGRIAVTAGYSYVGTMYFYPTSDLRQTAFGLTFYNSSGSTISGGTVSAPSIVMTQNTWNTLNFSFTVPTGATSVAAAPGIQWKYASQSVPASDLTYISAT